MNPQNAKIIALRSEGDTYEEIALKMSMTKSAIAGRIYRISTRVEDKAKIERKKLPGEPNRYGCTMRQEVSKELADRTLNLRGNQCRYITGEVVDPDAKYCNKKQFEKSPYCEKHHKLCKKPLPPRKQKEI